MTQDHLSLQVVEPLSLGHDSKIEKFKYFDQQHVQEAELRNQGSQVDENNQPEVPYREEDPLPKGATFTSSDGDAIDYH